VNYCFDTSAINQLHDDGDREAILAGLKAAHSTYITSINIAEILANKGEDRRRSLLILASRLVGDNNILVFPNDLLQARMKDYAAGLARRGVDELVGRGTFRDFFEMDEKNRVEFLWWKESMDKSFDGFREARPKYDEVFAKGTDRPDSLSDLIRNHFSEEAFLHSIVSDLYERTAGKKIEPNEVQALFDAIPELPLFLLGMANAILERSMRTEGYRPKGKVGACDLWSAAYLMQCDCFVTFDTDQYKNFRRLYVINPRKTRTVLYSHFKKRMLVG
jgi:predicted nucleic acid-binding protein